MISLRTMEAEATPILIHGQPFEMVSSYKLLGAHLDNKLDWKNTMTSLMISIAVLIDPYVKVFF